MYITINDIMSAIKKNGYEHYKNGWFGIKDEKIVAACVLGQAALNLSVRNFDISSAFNRIHISTEQADYLNKKYHKSLKVLDTKFIVNTPLSGVIYTLNDELKLDYDVIVAEIELLLPSDEKILNQKIKAVKHPYKAVKAK